MNPNPKLRKYTVQGWLSDPDDKNAPRRPMKKTVIEALSAEAAAWTYARVNQIPDKLWNNGSAKPPIVIRVDWERKR